MAQSEEPGLRRFKNWLLYETEPRDLFGYSVFRPKVVRAGLSILLILSVWEITSMFYPPSFLPGPTLVAQRISEIMVTGVFWTSMAATFRRVLVGFAGAILAAVPIGILMGTHRFAEDFFEVEVIVGVTIPGLMWAMISIMLLGIRELAAYFAVAIIVLPILAINLWEGMKDIDNDLNQMAIVFETSRTDRVKDVVVPQLLPYIFASARFGLGLCWKVVVVIEMLGFSSGVGYQVTQSFQMFDMPGVLAWTLSFTMVMLVLEYGVLNHLEERWMGWRPDVEVWRR